MSQRTKLFRLSDPYNLPASDTQFLRAVRENCSFHYARCPEYRAVLDSFSFRPEDLRDFGDLERLPFLPTLTFKQHRLFSLPRRKMAAVSTSSGTSGRFSQVGFDFPALWCSWNMLWKIGRLRGFFSPIPTHYIILGYKPHRGNRTSVARTAFGATLLSPALSRTYALTYENGGYVPDLAGVADALVRHGNSRFPVRLVGFPAYTYFLLRQMEARHLQVPLRPGSKILRGGGWKQFYPQQVDKPVLYDLVKRVLGLDNRDIIEVFSAVEHPILYADCVAHHFHIPIYSRAIIRDVSLRLDQGELVCLLGVSGAGKTTLFHALSGLEQPEAGRVLLSGEDITGRPGKISYMLQKDLLLPHKKVADNVALPLVLRGEKPKAAREKALGYFAQFGLEGTGDKYPAQLSGGMRQRAALLRTFLGSQGVVLLDEPFSALDALTKREIHRWYMGMMDQLKLTTLFITHDIDEAILLSDRIYILAGSPGCIAAELTIQPSRPRTVDFALSGVFLDYKKQILSLLGQS